jgi:hypothetical protein
MAMPWKLSAFGPVFCSDGEEIAHIWGGGGVFPFKPQNLKGLTGKFGLFFRVFVHFYVHFLRCFGDVDATTPVFVCV